MAQWLTEFLESDHLDLVCFGDAGEEMTPRFCNDKVPNPTRKDDCVIYSDFSPLMLISEASLVDLNEKLEKKVTMRNFRPNLVAKNCATYAEDEWKKFSIGQHTFEVIKHCTRYLFLLLLSFLLKNH